MRNVTKVPKMQKLANKCPKVQKGVKKAGLYFVSATICTRRESRCLPYGGFVYIKFIIVVVTVTFTLCYRMKKSLNFS